jgi:hypothetical protein
MTIDQFRSTGRDVPDLGAVIGDEEVTRGQPGRVYCGCFWIAALPEPGQWITIVGNGEFSGPLHQVEDHLFTETDLAMDPIDLYVD